MANSKKKLDRIDLDELFDSPVNRGMLSFLQRPPEEARERLREKERVDRLDSNRLNYTQGESPTVTGPSKEGASQPAIQNYNFGRRRCPLCKLPSEYIT